MSQDITGISLFAGAVDGLGIAAEVAGIRITHCVEYEQFCVANLRRLHPKAVVIEDDICNVKTIPTADVLFGSPPCQGFSIAGNRAGLADERYLWPEMARLVRQSRPRCVVVENVLGSVSGGLVDAVCDDLEAEEYTCWSFLLPACVFGAPHERYRVFIVAYTERVGQSITATCEEDHSHQKRNVSRNQQKWWTVANANLAGSENVGYANTLHLQSHRQLRQAQSFARRANGQSQRSGRGQSRSRHLHQSRLGGTANGSAHWMDRPDPVKDFPGFPAGQGHFQYAFEPSRTIAHSSPSHKDRVQAIGNAVVWQQAFPVMKATVEWIGICCAESLP